MSKSEKKLQKKLKRHAGAIEGFSLNQEKYVSGLVTSRRPTDVFFCMIFVGYILTLLGIAGYSVYTGDPMKLVAHQDGNRRFCGIDEAVKDYPKVYWTFEENSRVGTNLEKMFMSAVCVKKCPVETTNGKLDCVNTKYSASCNIDNQQIIGTKDVLGMCIVNPSDVPENVKDDIKMFRAKLKEGDSGKMIEDLSNSWLDIVICLFLAMVYALTYMYLMSTYPTAIAYTAIVVMQLIYVVGGGFCFYQGFHQTDEDTRNGMFIGGASFVIVGLFFDIMLWCYWTQFMEGIAIVDATADFFVATKRIIFVSIGTFFMQFMLTLGCVMVFLCICASGEIKPLVSSLDVTLQGKDITLDGTQKGFSVALFFGFLWVAIYLKNQTVMTCMCSVSTYYFSSNANGEGSAQVVKALYWSNVYHAGSVAFGSLIMAIITFVQAFLENVQGDSDNAAARCVSCCLKCIEDIIEYINTIAYANMAVSGDSFCTSAWNGFIINLKHMVKFYFAQTLAKMFVFIGFLFVTFGNIFSHFLISKYITQTYDDITYQGLPTTIIVVFTLITCALFMGLFDEAVVATLQCMGVDRELNDGTSKYGPPTMHEKLRAIYGEDYGKPVQEQQVHEDQPQTYVRNNSLV